MANFNTHFTVAATASAVMSAIFMAMEVVTPSQAVIAFSIGTLGGLMPDVDSANSKAIRVGFNVVSLLLTIMVVFVKSSVYSIVEMLAVSGVVFYILRYGMIDVFRKVSKHRGMFHSIPVALIFGVSVAIMMHLFFGLNALISWIYGLMTTFGYLVHLTLDEVYSVDLGNRRVKKSLGTALKFYRIKNQSDKIQNVIIYGSLFALMLVAPDTAMLKDALFSQEALMNFWDVLIPHDGNWFFK